MECSGQPTHVSKKGKKISCELPHSHLYIYIYIHTYIYIYNINVYTQIYSIFLDSITTWPSLSMHHRTRSPHATARQLCFTASCRKKKKCHVKRLGMCSLHFIESESLCISLILIDSHWIHTELKNMNRFASQTVVKNDSNIQVDKLGSCMIAGSLLTLAVH